MHNPDTERAAVAPDGGVDQARRGFLGQVGGAASVALLGGGAGLATLAAPGLGEAAEIGPLGAPQRALRAYQVRTEAARRQRLLPTPAQPTNSDDDLYPTRIGSFTKGLPHNAFGEVDGAAYQSLLTALASGNPAHFASITLGGTVKLANPQAAYAYELEGPDSHHLGMPAAPAFASAHAAAEMAEVYWRALTRDVPFTDYATDPVIAAAAADLNALSDYRGPKQAGAVTPGTLFRGNTPGDLVGPLLSQFLWQDVPYGLATMPQRFVMPTAGQDFMTSEADWLASQNGTPPVATTLADPDPRYIASGRDLAEWVHKDFPYQAFLSAGLILLGYGGAALDAGNPYRTSTTQGGFISYGVAHVLDLVSRVARQALKAAWFHKWLLHRRVRPEAYAGSVHMHLTGQRTYPIPADLLASSALDAVFSETGTYLLPMAYPEGCPTHPSYPAGHATIAGACATVLKAFFNESFQIPNPVQASFDGAMLEPYAGVLTVGGELNKLAANVALARDTAGVHYRADGIEGIRLGEQLAIGMLRDYRECHNEPFAGFSLTRFDGTTVTVGV